MNRKSVKHARSKRLQLDRPFDPKIRAQAEDIARKYRIVLETSGKCGFVGTSLEMPGVFADGQTADACVEQIREALTAAVAYLLEKGAAPPAPADQQLRTKQVHVRLTEAEQSRLKEAAKAHGFSDISDYVRSTSLCAH